MFLYFDKNRRLQAGFRHWSNAMQYETENKHLNYERVDMPDLCEQIEKLVGNPIEPDRAQ